MSFSSRKRTASALLTVLMLSGCSVTERLNTAATTQGQVRAGINLAPLPDDCRVKEAHAPITVGVELHSTLVWERGALGRQNARTDRCAAFYDGIKSRYAGTR